MNEFIAYIVRNLVDCPDEVKVNVFEGDQSIVVELSVAASDIAKVVGKQGRTIKALRTLANTVAIRFGKRIKIDLIQ